MIDPNPSNSPAAGDDRAAAPTSDVPVGRWALHRRLYDWVLSLADRKYATTALCLLSFAESSFFPIPPDVLLIPMAMQRRRRAMWYATVCTAASVIGGMFGYLIGWGLWEVVGEFLLEHVPGFEANFNKAQEFYDRYDFWIVFFAGFTPLPYKVFTIAGGVASISFPMLIIASIVGRGARFFLVAGLMWKFGEPVKHWINRYFSLSCIIFAVLLAGGFAVLKLVN